jgi:hypothetical protein
MNINKLIKEEFTKIIKEDFEYKSFDSNNNNIDDIQLHLNNTMDLLNGMGRKFIETYDNKIIDFKLILSTKEIIEDIIVNIKNMVDNNKEIFDQNEALDELQYNIKNILYTFEYAFDELESLFKINIENIYDEFKNDFTKYNKRGVQ